MRQRLKLLIILLLLAVTTIPALGLAAEIPQALARQVANNFLQDYVTTYGKWAGSDRPLIEDIELVSHEGAPITYNIRVNPRGHLLVPFFDDFSPVVLYSDTSGFIPSRISESGSVESWILPEMSSTYKNIQAKRAALTAGNKFQYSETAVARAWNVIKENEPSTRAAARSAYRNATLGPLLTTAWDQGYDNTAPYTYNLYTPQGSGTSGTCTHTLTGCVATAWSQMMKYWSWPDVGVGSHSYTWNGQTLSANFAHAYDWANMPSQLTSSSTTAQIQAVAQLIYDIGVATEMNYGCSSVGGSGSNMYADNPAILPAFFKYSTGMQQISRGSFTASQWFNLFKAEFDAVPPRPIIFSIFSTSSGHEIVADGYQTGTTNYVHVNMGWSGNYNGYYDVTNNWTTGSSTWEANSQVIVTGIQPDNAASTCTYSISPASQTFTATAGTGSITVTASASSCTWSATSNDSWATITSGSGAGSGTAAFSVSANTTASSRTGSLTIAGQTFTLTQAGSVGTTATNLLLNPDFESGNVNWTESTIATSAIITNSSAYAHAGSWFAWLGGYDSAVDYIYQDVIIPSDAQQPYLQFWYSISTQETTTSVAYDTMVVEIRRPVDNALLKTAITLSNLNKTSGWVPSLLYDLSAFKGQGIRLRFYATTDTLAPTNFGIDDVSLNNTVITACTFSITPISQIFTSTGGTGSVSVTASDSSCAWAATESLDWVTITLGSSGTGNGTVQFAVSANTALSERTGNIDIAGQTFLITQSAAPSCTFTIKPVSKTFTSIKGNVVVDVSATGNSCTLNPTESYDWITAALSGKFIQNKTTKKWNGKVKVAVTENNSSTARTGTVDMGGKTFTVTQGGKPCTLTITPAAAKTPMAGAGGTGSFTVKAPDGCNWSAVSANTAWLTLTSGDSGSGNGAVNYTGAENTTGKQRTGKINVVTSDKKSKKIFTVVQKKK